MSVRTLVLSLVVAAAASLPALARECTYGELNEKEGERATMTAKIKAVDPEEDNPKQVFITVDNTAADHCFTFISQVPKPMLGNCAVGKTVTASGRIHSRMEAWWGLEKITSIKCK